MRKVGEFDRIQWVFQAPHFHKQPDEIPHFDLDDNCVMPFVEDHEENPKFRRAGGYSELWPVRIHPAHQNLLDSTNPRV
jgi:hypothetical protein